MEQPYPFLILSGDCGFKLNMYLDDILLILSNTARSVPKVVELIKFFQATKSTATRVKQFH